MTEQYAGSLVHSLQFRKPSPENNQLFYPTALRCPTSKILFGFLAFLVSRFFGSLCFPFLLLIWLSAAFLAGHRSSMIRRRRRLGFLCPEPCVFPLVQLLQFILHKIGEGTFTSIRIFCFSPRDLIPFETLSFCRSFRLPFRRLLGGGGARRDDIRRSR